MKKEKLIIGETVSFEQASAPEIAHHVERMAADAKEQKKAQRFVLSSGMHDEGIGETVLTVKPDGGHSVEFVAGGKNE